VAEKTLEELQMELMLLEAIKKEREITDRLYAIKLVENIVFAMIGFILIAVFGAIVALVII
jgi:hypothetical protein